MRAWRLLVWVICFGLLVWGFEEKVETLEASEEGKEAAMAVKLQWFGHASFKITAGEDVIYIDPWKLKECCTMRRLFW